MSDIHAHQSVKVFQNYHITSAYCDPDENHYCLQEYYKLALYDNQRQCHVPHNDNNNIIIMIIIIMP